MRNRFLFLGLGLCWAAVGEMSAEAASLQTAPGILLDSYTAVVNGKVITVGEVLDYIRPEQERLMMEYQSPELEKKVLEAFKAGRDRLVASELILADFAQQGATLPERAIEDHINGVIHDRFQNDRTAFLKALAEERTTYSDWRKQMQDQLIQQVMRQREVISKILITPYDIQTYYNAHTTEYTQPERVKLRLYTLPEKSKTPVKELVKRIQQGALSPEDAAKHFRMTVLDDGEFLETSSLQAALRTAIQSLKIGAVTGPVSLDGRNYIVQLMDREQQRLVPLEDVSDTIERSLRQKEFERLEKIWLNTLRSKYYVQMFANDLFQ